MKRTIIFGLISAFVSFIPLCADENADDEVKKIGLWYSAIEENKELKKETFSEGEEGIDAFQFARYTNKKGQLQKIWCKTGGDHGVSEETYYFHDGDLFFVYVASQYWRFTGKQNSDGQSETMDVANQLRLYFKDGACIKALEKGIEIVGADEIRNLLEKRPNKELKITVKHQSYRNSARLLMAIESDEDLNAYLNRR